MNTLSPAVSIIVRTKDRPGMLARAIEDVRSQSFKDWELIIANDGGDRRAVEAVIPDDAAFRDRLVLLHNATSKGMEAASNQALSKARGSFIAVHDDDDTWAPDFLTETRSWLLANPDAAAVAASCEIVIEELHDDRFVEVDRYPFNPPVEAATAFDLILVNRFVPISMLFRKSVFDEIGGFDESLSVVGDWEFNLRMAFRREVGFLAGPPRAFWHQRPRSVGALANSVHGGADQHALFDRLVRDRELKSYVERNGPGLPLYISKVLDERVAEAERNITQRMEQLVGELQDTVARLQNEVQYNGVGHTIRRNTRRLMRRRRP